MNDFDYDCMVKKRIASGARHMKNGSKSRRCSLSSDNLTTSQWKKKNGKVTVMNLNQPMQYADFKSMPEDLQKEYITKLLDTYGCTLSALANLFGITTNTVIRMLDRLGISRDRFDRSTRMTKEQKMAFEAWQQAATAKEPGEADTPKEAIKTNETDRAEDSAQPTVSAPEIMAMNHMEFVFEGVLNLQQIMNTLRYAADQKRVALKIIIDEVKSGV